MRHRIPLAVLIALAFTGTAQAHPRPLKLATVEHAALQRAYHWWHQKPCQTVPVLFRELSPGQNMVPFGCGIVVNRIDWPRDIMWHIRHDHYRSRKDLRGVNAWDPYGVEAWQAFCGTVAYEIGGMLGHQPSSNPSSIMYTGTTGGIGSPVPKLCGTSA